MSSHKVSPERTPTLPEPAVKPSTSGNMETKMGRPVMEFHEGSERTKRRKVTNLADKHSTTQLVLATHLSLRRSGSADAAAIVKEASESSPTSAKKMRLSSSSLCPTEMPAEVALSVMVETASTVSDYNKYRQISMQYNAPIFPSYKKLLQAKKKCYPEGITVSETCASVPLQSLLDHTVERILTLQFEVIRNLRDETVENLVLYVKWGCDGSSGQSQYKQSFSDASVSDASMFLTTLAPLRLVPSSDESANSVIIWKNARPSSPRYCRPMKVEFMIENAASIVQEKERIENEIKSLTPYETCIDGKIIKVQYKLFFTMIDGKVCNAITETKSAMRCYLCGVTSKDFNKVDLVISKPIKDCYLSYGMSTLHAWIRFMECLLHIGYRIGVDCWQMRGSEVKDKVEKRKKNIQESLQKKLGLKVDIPKQGFGTSNDGNTARRFFQASDLVSKILGVNLSLIQRFHVILQVLSCGFVIDVEAFNTYCLDTARLFVDLYNWYNMPTSVHKVLIHGPQIIEASELPIGELSEDAQEARNKDFKKYRESYSRKISREKTMEDVFHWLLASSDPLITGMRKIRNKKGKNITKEALKLLVSAELSDISSDECDSECSEEPSTSKSS